MVYFLIRILIDNMTSNQNPSHLLLKRLLNFYENDLFDDAEVLANLILEQYPDNQFALKVLSAILKKTQRFEDALLINKKSIGANPKDPEAYYNIANTFKSLNRYTEAINNYKKAIAINPDCADTYNKFMTSQKNSAALIFSDAAVAVSFEFSQDSAILGFDIGGDGRGADKLCIGTTQNPQSQELFMDGASVMMFTMNTVPGSVKRTLDMAGIDLDDVDLFFR